MSARSSIVRRVAWGSVVAASAAAVVSAFATVAFAFYLIRSVEDRRLLEAASTFASELRGDVGDPEFLRTVYRDESEEMGHTGMAFAVFDAGGDFVVGDRRLTLPTSRGCSTIDARALRVCRSAAENGRFAVAGDAPMNLPPVLGGAAALAAVVAAVLAWLASFPISRYVVAPLTRLRERIGALSPECLSQANLGPQEGIAEIDSLRTAIRRLIERVEQSLALAQHFAANAAHELRTPLTTVRGELELLAESVNEPSPRANVLRAQSKLAELVQLVERLLILALPHGQSQKADEVVSLRDVIEDAVHALPHSEQQRVAVTESDGLVRGDGALLGTLIANALLNGLKFGHKVSIGIEIVSKSAIIYVEDDGPGINVADRERVFEPFVRTEAAVSQRIPGHGLGLALIKHIAQVHSGSAAFGSIDCGTRLEITLPLIAT